jgi:restriction endonuclease S subunit
MVKLCKPKFKYGDVPESVCDPTMGTGGFLTAYLKHFKNVDWSKHQSQLHGVDHDAKVAGVARLNMFMESKGTIFKNLHTGDSLHGGLDPTSYDIILANMPFGLKGLKYADVHSSVKELHLDGTKSEPLFLQLMMVSLNKGGRCAVVVPDGMLVNKSKCHNGTRKYLLEHFEVKRIIKMKGKFFMNTGIEPSILFFENSGKKTEQVEFWEAERDDKGNFDENMVVSVSVDEIDPSYSLDMRKYQKIDYSGINPSFEMIKIGDILDYAKGKVITLNDKVEGNIPLYSTASEIFTHNEAAFPETPSIIQACVGSNLYNSVHYTTFPFSITCSVWVLRLKEDFNKALLKYIYYYLKITKITEKRMSHSVIPGITKESFNDIEIPIPSIELQKQIIEELDPIYESKVQSNTLIENLKKQMKSNMNCIDKNSYERKSLKDIAKVSFGERITKKENTGTRYPVYGSGKETFRTDRCNRSGLTCKIGRFAISEETMVMFVSGDYWLLDSALTIESSDETEVLSKFIWYSLLMDKKRLCTTSTGSCQKNIDMDDIYKLTYRIPPIEVQKALVEKMDTLHQQITCLEQLNEEENAKFILNNYISV